MTGKYQDRGSRVSDLRWPTTVDISGLGVYLRIQLRSFSIACSLVSLPGVAVVTTPDGEFAQGVPAVVEG